MTTATTEQHGIPGDETAENDAAPPDVDMNESASDLSDATFERLLRWVMWTLGAAVVIGLFAAAAVWAASGDDEVNQPMNAVDVGFLRDMLDHHEQALVISEIYLEERPDSGVAPYAREVILYQEREIGWMEDWLAEEGYSRGESDRRAMSWMGMSVPVSQMPGMQSDEELARLDAATGEDADLLFFAMMSDHHQGGIEMGEFAAANGADQEIMDFADAVARNQRIEINEYVAAAERLGLIPERSE